MGGGILGNYLLRKIVEHNQRKRIKGKMKLLMEITEAYLVYVDAHPEDANQDVQDELEIVIDHIYSKF